MISTSVIVAVAVLQCACSQILELEPGRPAVKKLPSLTEDDILVKQQDPNVLFSGKIIDDATALWSDGVVPFEISGDLFLDDRATRIGEAIVQFNKYTCVRFVRRTTESDYVTFIDGGERRCYSYVGRVGGMQELSVGKDCQLELGVIVHEMLHAIGFIHEQSRPDRDNHVDILWDYVIPTRKRNFDKYPEKSAHTMNVPYDYSSIMHYESNAFSINGNERTIVTKESSAQNLIGQRKGFSSCDLQKLYRMYKCEGTSFADQCKSDALPTTTPSVNPSSVATPTTPISSSIPTLTTPSTTITTADPTDCQETYSGCKDIRYDLTSCDKFPGIYRRLCPKTCNQCKGPICIDSPVYGTMCAAFKGTGQCNTQFLVRAICPLSCGLCSPPLF